MAEPTWWERGGAGVLVLGIGGGAMYLGTGEPALGLLSLAGLVTFGWRWIAEAQHPADDRGLAEPPES